MFIRCKQLCSGVGHEWGVRVMFFPPTRDCLALGQPMYKRRVRKCEVSDVRKTVKGSTFFCLQLWCERSTSLYISCLGFQLSGSVLFGLEREDFKAMILFLRPDQDMWSSSVSPGGPGVGGAWETRALNVSVTITLAVIYTGNGEWHVFELTK